MTGAAARLGWGVLSTICLLPLWPMLVRGDAPAGYRLLLVAVWLAVAALRQRAVVLAAVLPLGLFWAKVCGVSSSTLVAESLALACASGGAFGMTLRYAPQRTLLGLPALVLGAAIVTSAFVELWAVRAVAPMRPFFTDLWYHVRVLYWTEDAGNWIVVHDAVRWVGALVMAAIVERAIRAHESGYRVTVWAWLAAAAAATSFTAVRVGEVVVRRQTGIVESIAWIFTNVRLSVLHPDPNAAGSILAWLVAAGLIIGLRRRLSWMLVLVVAPLAATFVFAQSRAAVGALVVVLLARWLVPRLAMARGLVWMLIAATAIVAAVGTWMASSRSHIAATQALALRVQMLEVGLKMAARFPVFGVGLGDYARTSRRFIPPDLQELAVFASSGKFDSAQNIIPAGENAHNNFLQVLVELGSLAFVAFLGLVLPAAAVAWRGSPGRLTPEQDGLCVGLSAFLISAFFGHPLLIPEVQTMWAIGLGLAVACVDLSRWTSRPWTIGAWAAASFYAASLLWRLS